MEAVTVDECAECVSLIFPGDEVFSRGDEALCSMCHDKLSVRFCGLVLY